MGSKIEMRKTATDATAHARQMTWAIALPVLRIVLVAAASTVTWLIITSIEPGVSFPPPAMLAAVAMLPVNLICLWLLSRLLRAEGRGIRLLLGFEPRRIGKDLLWGLLWILVLYLPFSGTIIFVTWLQHGREVFERMQTVFFDPASVPTLTPVAWSVLAIVAVVTFAPLNAPVEELVYRGYAQGNLARSWWTPLAVVIPSILFGVQHIWYAATPDAVVAYVCAFFVWGIGSALIYQRQRRLMPIVFAHGVVNLLFTLPALAVPFFLAQSAPA